MDDDDVLYSEDTVFHYTRASAALEHILFNHELRLTRMADTNDPREYQDWSFHLMGWGASDDSPEPPLDRLEEVRKQINKIARTEYRLACFCANPVGVPKPSPVGDSEIHRFGFARSRMWSQYAEDHRGVCIAFSRSELEFQLGTAEFVLSGLVKYQWDVSVAGRDRTLNSRMLAQQGELKFARDYVRANARQMFFTKHMDYQDEAEYRLLGFDRDGTQIYLSVRDAIRGIIVGDRFELAYLPLIERASSELGVVSRKVDWSHGTPTLLYAKGGRD